MDNISFYTEGEVTHPFADKEHVYLKWLQSVATAEKRVIENLQYIFCDDDCLLDINIRHLGHDYYTDIITFPYREGMVLEGDMYISVDRVSENAGDYGVTFETELRRVMVHGMLHLMGYSDKTPEDQIAMRAKEDSCLAMFDMQIVGTA